jgi:cytoskeletal protein CcmA (bactofilin family)
MFGNKKNETNGANTAVSVVMSNMITTGTKIEGNINASSDMRIDGELVGNLYCNGKVVIGAEGKIIGDIDCQNAVIEGIFQGRLKCSELLNIRETAQIKGEITTDKLMVQSGAVFNVVCNMGGYLPSSNGQVKSKEAITA